MARLTTFRKVPGATLIILRRLAERLGRVPSVFYICIYLSTILAFSVIYYVLPGRQFYHSTSQYEYDRFNKDADKILSALQSNIAANIARHYKLSQPVLNVNGWKIDVGSLSVHSLYVGKFPDQFSFRVSAPLSYMDRGRGEIRSSLRSAVVVPVKEKMVSQGVVYLFIQTTGAGSISIKGYPASPIPDVLFPYTGVGFVNGPILAIPVSLYGDIIGFGQGYRGFPAKVRGQYLRMLYFSAGVSTSSALGDIVPLTSTARLLVTVQALLAMVVLGLFLNALAHTVAANLNKQKTQDPV